MKKKLLSLVLTICMLFSTMVTLSVTAFAQGEVTDGTLTDTQLDEIVAAGTGTVNINGVKDLKTFRDYSNAKSQEFSGVTVQFNADIIMNENLNALEITPETDLSQVDKWTILNGFRGTLNGNGHKIKGMCVAGERAFIAALKSPARVENLIFEDCYIQNEGGHAGFLAAQINEVVTVDNVTVMSSYMNHTGVNNAGGIVGAVKAAATIKNCHVTAGTIISAIHTVESNILRAGGIVGYFDYGSNNATIQYCTNDAAVTSTGVTGGILGGTRANPGFVQYCHNTGNLVSGADFQGTYSHCGGIVGHSRLGGVTVVENCSNAGTVTARFDLAKDGQHACAGGIFGKDEKGIRIENCFNKPSATVTAWSGAAGGIVGQAMNAATLIWKNVNAAEVTTLEGATLGHAGGLIGYAMYKASVENCLSAGDVTAQVRAGGFIGLYTVVDGTFLNSIVTGEVSSRYNEASEGAFFGYTLVNNTDAAKYIQIENCYYVKNSNDNDQYALGLWSDAAGASCTNIRVIYPGVDFTFVGGTHNAGLSGWDNMNAYSAMFNDPTNANYTGACVEDIADLCGMKGAILLSKAGYDFGTIWNVSEGLPVPNTVAMSDSELDTTADIVYKGYQTKIGEGLSIRLIAGLDSLTYANVGYDVYVLKDDTAVSTAPVQLISDTVYTQLNTYTTAGEGAPQLSDPITADALSCEYLSALTVTDLPTSGTVKLVVTPYVTDAEMLPIYGSSVVLVIVNGVVTAQYAM